MNYSASVLAKAALRARRLLPTATGAAILMYHRIGEDEFDPWGLCVGKERFARQIDWLSRNRLTMPLTELAERHREGKLDKAAVAVTFDDGYASTLDAVPILEGHGVQATVFLPVELIARRRRFWWDELAQLVVRCASDQIAVGDRAVAVPAADASDGIWPPHAPPRTPRQKLFHTLWSKLRTRPPREIESVMAGLRAVVGSAESGDRPLQPEEVKSIRSTAVDFGSHALTHPYLPGLDTRERMREIGESVTECERLTGRVPASFSYPYGDCDSSSIATVRDAGFRCACATGNAFVNERSDPFALPRQYVGDWEPGRLGAMLGAS